MNNRIQFRMVAFTGAAGKFDPTAPMGGNEDNFYVDDNLSDEITSHFEADQVFDLAEYGLIMAVADGMGGQNAGEVASGIAVKTVQEYFAPSALNNEIVGTPEARKAYLEGVVIEADRRIKEDAEHNPEHEGMGSTIILAWIVGDKLTLTWCGDSRAYRYNPSTGIELLSKDHSYVQELVNRGLITYEDTFEHPQGNIVTRSLGERGNKAKPETCEFDLYDNDIILLCSDGLNGVLRDKKTYDPNGKCYPGENIEDIIKDNCRTLKQCKDALWNAAERADWYDNVTIILCQILQGGKMRPAPDETWENNSPDLNNRASQPGFFNRTIKNLRVTPYTILLVGLLAIGLMIGGYYGISCISQLFEKQKIVPCDSVVADASNLESPPLLAADNKKIAELLAELLAELDDLCNNLEDSLFQEKITAKVQEIEDALSLAEASALDEYIGTIKEKISQIQENLQKQMSEDSIIRAFGERLQKLSPGGQEETSQACSTTNPQKGANPGTPSGELTEVAGQSEKIVWICYLMPSWEVFLKDKKSLERLNGKLKEYYELDSVTTVPVKNLQEGKNYLLKFSKYE